jgi:Domain of unknown function (DUF1771)
MGLCASGIKADRRIEDDDGVSRANDKESDVAYKKEKRRQEQQHNETDADYRKYHAKADAHAKRRAELFEEANAAHKAGDGARAKKLSEQAKSEGELMEKANREASDKTFANRNRDNAKDTIDLHGQQLKPALAIIERHLDAGKKGQTLTVIYGAGNHSAGAAKIKNGALKMFRQRKLKFEELNNGSAKITF